MPLYDYECNDCGKQFDEFLPLSEYKKDVPCPECEGSTHKRFTTRAIQDDHPVWLDQSIRNQLQDTDGPHIPIETRKQYNDYLKDTGIVPDR